MNTSAYFSSLALELRGLQNRVRNFLDDSHWLTDGEWKESVLRSILRRHLPSSAQIGRGFIVRPDANSRQIDLLIYNSNIPVLFREGDLVFVTPDAVLGVIEVKTSLNNTSYAAAVDQLGERMDFLLDGPWHPFFGLFAYESTVGSRRALEALSHNARGQPRHAVDLVCLGYSHLLKWWPFDPADHRNQLNRWRSYRFDKEKSPGYFLHNVIELVSPESVRANQDTWFPPEGSGLNQDDEEALR